jgi:hypothetical protein
VHKASYAGECSERNPCSSDQLFCLEGILQGECAEPWKIQFDRHKCARYCAPSEFSGVEHTATPAAGPNAQQRIAEPELTNAFLGPCSVSNPCGEDQFYCVQGANKGACSPKGDLRFYSHAHGCERFCASSGADGASGGRQVLKAVCYTPVPERRDSGGGSWNSTDFMAEEASALWSSAEGRGDLRTLRMLGANGVRLHTAKRHAGSHRRFLDEASREGLQVVTGFVGNPECIRRGFNCYHDIKALYSAKLMNGFLDATGKAYHPALRLMVLLEQPDHALHQNSFATAAGMEGRLLGRAAASALDAVLDAEKELKVQGVLPNFTVTFPFKKCHGCAHFGDHPALGQMAELRAALQNPEKVGYTPNNDLWAAYQARFVNSVDTSHSFTDFRRYFLELYDGTFQGTPVFISKYRVQNVWIDLRDELQSVLKTAESGSSMLTGIAFYEFQAHGGDRTPTSTSGLFDLGFRSIGHFRAWGEAWTSWCLDPVRRDDSSSGTAVLLPEVVALAYMA